ncbi:protein obstructor-E-like isoform X2 [Portunus trituberculatus]|uniref:protein obstructor-E-like isoform X2 n=1 Tax=Portunus trituberculatus TaxID=210409 RepID=UPI001E1D13F5|nr:protein obstructor-E-like isoform X2 [Portunus trituberculatus]
MQQPTYPSEFCVRRHGVFADPNEAICNRFHTCKDGFQEGFTDCTAGLHFDPKTGICTWPEAAGRTGCAENPQSCLKNGNFCCDGRQVFTAEGLAVPHPSYVNLDDCQKFYVCLNNLVPQESSCPLGQVFNDKTSLCDYPENVPECQDFYANHPLSDVLNNQELQGSIREFIDRRAN